MEKVIEYLNTGETIAFVGAGVPREIGVLDWNGLAGHLLEALPASLGKDRLQEAERLAGKHRYAELCGWIVGALGDDFLYEQCREVLRDTGKSGQVSEFIAQFPFKAVFTTNFDDSLERHFREAGKAVSVFRNTESDLAAVDIDTIPCVVKLHSDLDHTGTIILTEGQYAQARSKGDWEYFRQFVRGYFATKRILIIGYSMSDPDITLMLEQVAQNLRRVETPIIAIVANATAEDKVSLKTKFNVDVVSYANASGNHAELGRLLEAMAPFVGEVQVEEKDRDLDLQRAQSLYLWSRFGLGPELGEARVDSLKSVLLHQLSKAAEPEDGLVEAVGRVVGLSPEMLGKAVSEALADLAASGLVEKQGEIFGLSPNAGKLVEQATGQHRRLASAFDEQVRIDLTVAWGDRGADDIAAASGLVSECLMDVFRERGVEIVNSAFGEGDSSAKRSASLFYLLSQTGSQLGDADLQYRFVKYMVDVLTAPKDAQKSYLEHLAIAFFSLSALTMDPEGYRFREEYLRAKTLLVDSNVLIPLVPLSGVFRPEVEALMSLVAENQIPLVTTWSFIEEIHRHATWAQALVDQHGVSSIEVLDAARGDGYRRNALLDGFVRYSVEHGEMKFNAYLRECLGGRNFTSRDIGEWLSEQYGIELFDFKVVSSARQEAFVDRDETEEFIREQAELRDIGKSEGRTKSEAEAYAIVANWDAISGHEREGDGHYSEEVGVLSQGGFLNRIARYGPRPVNRFIVIPPDSLYGFLLSAGKRPADLASSFRELMVSPMFDASTHFVDKEKYRQFFRHLINDADRIFRDHLQTFQSQIDSELRPEFYEEIEPLERPSFLASLQWQIESKLSQSEAKQAELAEKLARTEHKLRKEEKHSRNVEAALSRKARKKAERQGNRKKKPKR